MLEAALVYHLSLFVGSALLEESVISTTAAAGVGITPEQVSRMHHHGHCTCGMW